jgi:hypothetical protein
MGTKRSEPCGDYTTARHERGDPSRAQGVRNLVGVAFDGGCSFGNLIELWLLRGIAHYLFGACFTHRDAGQVFFGC